MFKDKKILVIGGTGSIGQALIERILTENPAVIRVYSRDEYKQFLLAEKFRENANIRYLIGDVRDEDRLDRAMNDIDIVFNLAALKHVPACEYNPFEAVRTNVIGSQNVIACAMANKVKKVIYTSSDKAVSPTIPWVQQSFWQKTHVIIQLFKRKHGYGVCFCQIRKCNGHKRFSDSAFQAAGFGKGIYYGDRTGDDEVYDVPLAGGGTYN